MTVAPLPAWRAWSWCLLALLGWWLLPGHLMLGNQILITALFALSLDLILGYAGILSLGHAAWFGIGAYAAGLLALHGWQEPVSGLVLASVLAALAAWPVAWLVVNGTDLSRLMVTLGVGMLLYEAANKAVSLTGGIDGLVGIQMRPLLGVFDFDLEGRVAFLYSLLVLMLGFGLMRRLVASPFGLSLSGVRENRGRMEALGSPVRRRLMTVFVVAAAMAGAAGALLAQTTQFVGLDTLAFSRSAELLIILVLGGVGRLYGGLLGAALYLIAHDWLSGLDPVYWQFWIGLLLVLAVFGARDGLIGLLDRVGRRR